MSRRDPALDAATLRAELDLRWPDAVDDRRASTDETHRLVLCHPQYDGFVSLELAARADLDGVFVMPDRQLDPIVTSHHRTGPLQRGEVMPIDVELHPGNVPRTAASGELRFVDASGEDVARPMRLTIATDRSLECTLAGLVDGPLPADEFDSLVEELRTGRIDARRAADRVAGTTSRWWRRR